MTNTSVQLITDKKIVPFRFDIGTAVGASFTDVDELDEHWIYGMDMK